MVRSPYAGLVLAALAMAGCQDKPPFTFAPVEGTVTRDGKPLAGVVVTFQAETAPGTVAPESSAVTNAAGHYQLHTCQGQEGAVIGRHRVCLAEAGALLSRVGGRTAAADRVPKDQPKLQPSGVPAAHATKNETPLRAEVRPGAQVIDFEVK